MFHPFDEMDDDVVDFENANKNMRMDDVQRLNSFLLNLFVLVLTVCIYVEEIIGIVQHENLVNNQVDEGRIL